MMAQITKATYTQRRGSKQKGAYNAKHNTLEATRRGQPHIDEERIHLNRYIRFDRTGRSHSSEGGKGGFDAAKHERERYEELFGKGLEARNQRYLASRHKERCRTMGDVYQDLKTAPLESIWQVGNSHSDIPTPELKSALIQAWNLTYKELRGKYGENMVPLDAALHMDEAVPHIHFRVALGARDEYGHFMPNQSAALEAMGFERPDPTKPRSRYNNALISFTDTIREMFYQNCERCGLQIDREVQNASQRQIEILEYKCEQFKKDIAELKQQAEIQRQAAVQAQETLLKVSGDIKSLERKISVLEREKAVLEQKNKMLSQENSSLKQENQELRTENSDLLQQTTRLVVELQQLKKQKEEAEAARDKAIEDKAIAKANLEKLEEHQRGLYKSYQSRQIRKYGELPEEKEKKNWKGQVTQEAKPKRTIVATEDLERLEQQARYQATVDYNQATMDAVEQKLSVDDVVRQLREQNFQQQLEMNRLNMENQKQFSRIQQHENFLQHQGLENAFENHLQEHTREHTHHHHR